MKTICHRISNACMLLSVMLLAGFSALAQDAGSENKVSSVTTSTNSDAGGGTWYAAPWVWIVGAAVFILLLVAIVRGRGGRRVD